MVTRAAMKAETRQRIAEAARSRFLAQGFDAVSVAAIARDADVSRRTFFRYFPTKEAAFFANQEALIATLQAALEAPRAGETSWQTVRRALLTLAASFMRDRDVLCAQHAAISASRVLGAYDRQLDARWDALLAEALGRGLPHDGVARARAGWAAAALMGLVRGVLRAWFDDGGKHDLVARGREALDWIAPAVEAATAPATRPHEDAA